MLKKKGKKPNAIKGTRAVLRLTARKQVLEKSKIWALNIISQNADSVALQVRMVSLLIVVRTQNLFLDYSACGLSCRYMELKSGN